jgi:hypothetical protein
MKKLLPIVVAALVLIATQAFGATAYRYNDSVTTLRGDAVGGASVTVYLAGTTTKATIYLYGSTAVEKSNPTYTDGYGRYFFYAEPGLYDLTISGSNIIDLHGRGRARVLGRWVHLQRGVLRSGRQ